MGKQLNRVHTQHFFATNQCAHFVLGQKLFGWRNGRQIQLDEKSEAPGSLPQ